ncbi:MAG: hypothetical protein JW929_02035 [Anaerolineales bacterium]|nr:hypothetical protein [Anaerolineales bacterium]
MDLQEWIGHVVKPGERLIWSGRPPHGILLRIGDAFVIPLSLLWGAGVSGFLAFPVLLFQPSGMLDAFDLGMIAVALLILLTVPYLLLGRFFVDWFRRRNMHYLLTDRNVYIVCEFLGREVRTYALRHLGNISLLPGRGGRGTILLGPADIFSWLYVGEVFPVFDRIPQYAARLEGIDDAELVHRQILELHKDCRSKYEEPVAIWKKDS